MARKRKRLPKSQAIKPPRKKAGAKVGRRRPATTSNTANEATSVSDSSERNEALQRGLQLIRKRLAEGKLKFVESVAEDFKASLGKVKYADDGTVDLKTVDGRIRAMAWGLLGFEAREESARRFPLRDVQATYFGFIQTNFGDLFEQMTRRRADINAVSTAISRDANMVEKLAKDIPDFVSTISEFWDACAEPVWDQIQRSTWLKGVFGGDLFPSYARNIASVCGLYTDTIVLTDPFMNSRQMFPRWSKSEAVRYFVKHGLNILQYRDLALADLDPPIVLVVPFRSSWDESYHQFLVERAERAGLKHASFVFGRAFETVNELFEFACPLDTPEKAAAAVRAPDRLLFDTTFTDPLNSQIARVVNELGALSGTNNPGEFCALQCMSRMIQATEILEKSRELGGSPLIDAPTSWKYLNWKMEYDADHGPDNVALHMVRALQSGSESELTWLGNIPPKALIDVRKAGTIEDIRAILSDGVAELASVRRENFFRTSDKVVDNVTAAFHNYEQQLSVLREKKWGFALSGVGSWVVSGSIAIAAALTGRPEPALAALAANELLDAPKLRDIPGKIRALSSETSSLKKSPVGLLFSLAKK